MPRLPEKEGLRNRRYYGILYASILENYFLLYRKDEIYYESKE